MNGKDLRVIKTKQSLQRAFIELLKDKPLEKITVADLCRQSGITRKTFYLHYDNVPKYFEEFIARLLADLEQAMQKSSNYLKETNYQLEPKMIHLFEHVYNHKDFYQFIFSSNSNFAYYKMFFERIKAFVKSSVQSQELMDEPIEFIDSFLANAILGVILEWHNEGFQKSIDEMNGILLKLLKIDALK